ncbi:MAG: glycosyltransferase family 4 protein [Fulvivirga sp.]
MSLKSSVFLSHSGKQHVYHVAQALEQLGYLNKFYTSSYVRDRWLQKIIRRSGNKFFSKRFVEGLHGNKIKTHWHYEVKEFLLARLNVDRQKVQEAVYLRDVNFDRMVAAKLSKTNASMFWGFQGSSYESIKSANRHGLKTICELSTGHVIESIKILGEEAELQPKWSDSFDNLVFPESYRERLEQEPQEANMVIAASSFTKKTLVKSGIKEEKVKVLPLGFDHRFIPFEEKKEFDSNLKLLYTGRITQRKGVSYLLDAMKHLKGHATLDMIGFVHGKGAGLVGYDDCYTLLQPMNQHDLFKTYHNYDALILPSLFEGFGLVIVEALAAGLPVITTKNTVGADIIKNDFNGYLVEIRNSKAIEEAVEKLASKTDEEKSQMRANARSTAMKYSWKSYQQRLKDVLNDIQK